MRFLNEQYNILFKKGHLVESDAFYRWVLRTLRPQPGRLFVDVACGSGIIVQHAFRADLNAVGLDCAPEAIQQAKASRVKTGWLLADGHHLPIIVTSLGSLEHNIAND